MATVTPNFSWAVPTSTDLVKDGAVAIETLGDAIDARFGNVGTYPNQIVNVVSGVSRPLPYAIAGGTGSPVFTASTSGTVTITLPASRFTQTPIILLTNVSGSGNLIGSTYRAISATSSSFQISGLATAVITQTGSVAWTAIQMTSAAAAG
jgi:hypothetical protein